MMRKTLLICSAFLILLTGTMLPSLAPAQIVNMGQAINDAGRQRMLTQRMLKNYALIGLEIDPGAAVAQRDAAVELFDRQLTELVAFKVNNEVTSRLDAVQNLWPAYKQAITSSPSVDKSATVREMADGLLAACNEVVLALEDSSTRSASRLVNISGRQRMLSQRVTAIYALLAWGNESSRNKSAFGQSLNEFKGALAELLEANENTEEIDRALKKVKSQFAFFEEAARLESGKYIPRVIARYAEQILNGMDDITGSYAEL